MKKDDLLSAYRQAREEWEGLLAHMSEAEMAKTHVAGAWTVKDIIAHLVWHEHEMTQVAQQRALVGSPWWALPLDQRNAAIYELFKDRSLDDVLASAQLAHSELLQAFEALNDQDMLDPSNFADMPADWQPWQVFASNMHEHYQDHILALRDWLSTHQG